MESICAYCVLINMIMWTEGNRSETVIVGPSQTEYVSDKMKRQMARDFTAKETQGEGGRFSLDIGVLHAPVR